MTDTLELKEGISTWSHPECGDGETFLFNACRNGFQSLRYSSKRMGVSPYDGDGHKLSFQNWHPVFVQQSELNRCGLTVEIVRVHFHTDGVPGCVCRAHVDGIRN
jgi:hypothetical protein